MFKSFSPRHFEEMWPGGAEAVRAGRFGGLSALRQFAADVAFRHAVRKASRELQRLDDRMLRDIGLTRSEIGSAVIYGRHGR